jgi:hypothetical protein
VRRFYFCLSILHCLLLNGCGADSDLPRTVNAAGIVTLDGKPVEGAQVVIVPEPPAIHSAFGTTDAQGRFSLHASENTKGAVPGPYKVQISKTIIIKGEGKSSDGSEPFRVEFGVPTKYAATPTSGLLCTIPESGTTDLKFELTSK